jgi:hypothetical protein
VIVCHEIFSGLFIDSSFFLRSNDHFNFVCYISRYLLLKLKDLCCFSPILL